MAANKRDQARMLFKWAFGNAERTARITTWFDAAVEDGFSASGKLDAIMSGSKNGVQMQKMIVQNPMERIEVLDYAKTALAAGLFPGTRSRAYF
jgi:hypothetical protein